MNNLDIRIATHRQVSNELISITDAGLVELLQKSMPVHEGIGGSSSIVDLDHTKVFVKRVPLTSLEMQPDNLYSTRNLFNLPFFYQYGVGSAGFGAWRELKAHQMTTDWVVSGQCPNFILLYHWRILPSMRALSNDEDGSKLDESVVYWEGSAAVRNRLEALQQSTHDLCLFLEYIPETLYPWLEKKIKQGGEEAVSACVMVEKNLQQATAFANKNGLVHFDAHFENILTDGEQTYLCDLGLALSTSFDLTNEEQGFLDHHRYLDQCFVLTNLIHRIVTTLYGTDNWIGKLKGLLEKPDQSLQPELRDFLENYGPMTQMVDSFYQELIKGSKLTLYPARDLENLLKSIETNVE